MLLLVNGSSTESCSGCISSVSAEVTNVIFTQNFVFTIQFNF